jgi:hypothetical protein
MYVLENVFSILFEICIPIWALALIRFSFVMRNSEDTYFGKISACIGSVVISNVFLIICGMWALSQKEEGGVICGTIYCIGYFIVHYWNFSDLIKKS